jgi:cellulose synthase/poly-beta-1,6-N-acetylglucosamine synthase-like glycosyltransferase
MKLTIEFISLLSAIVVLLFALSQAWLALYYRKSKTDRNAVEPNHVWTGPLPKVLLQLPIFNEINVVERLLEAIAHLNYPRDLLSVQLLDDSTDDTTEHAKPFVAKLKHQGIHITHITREIRQGYKAGALQEGLLVDGAEFVAIFDADFIPNPNFIHDIIGYFVDPKVGMVQTRWEHLNEEQSLLTKLLSFAIDAHFSVEQGGRQAAHSFINFNGTAGMWRRKAIDEAGGWQSDCLTEDLDLSFRAQLKGWHFLFVEGITTPSELPAHMGAIRTQQFRWTKGAAETGRKTLSLLWNSAQPIGIKLIGSFHMLNSFVFPFLLLLSLTSILYPFVYGANVEQAFIPISLIMSIAFLAILYTYWVAHAYGQFQSKPKTHASIIARAFMFMLIVSGLCLHNGLAVLQGMFGHATPFMRTPKLNVLNHELGTKKKLAYSGEKLKFQNLVEMALAIIFIALSVFSLKQHYYSLVLVYAYFGCGYLMVSYYTLLEVLASRRSNQT